MSVEEAGETVSLDISQIMAMIPHRYPFLMLDRVTSIISWKSAVGIKNLTYNEPFFQGHFPARPVMPGVLTIEAMAQTAGVLVVHSLGEAGRNKLVYFMSIEEARFRKPLFPGDQMELHVEYVQHRRNVWKFRGEARVGSALHAEGVFSAMVLDP